MGEMEWFVGGSWHKRDDCSSKSGILCGSLPPRKRLLAGLKQNGSPFSDSNLLSSPLLQNTSNNINVRNVNGSSAPAREEASLSQDVTLVLVKDDAKRLGCDCDEIVKHSCGNLIPRSCNACKFVQTKSVLCFYCLKVCKDPTLLSDSAIWLSCLSCKRFIHYKCELRFSPGRIVDSATYVCFACRHSKIHQEKGVSVRKEQKSSLDKGTGMGSAEGSCSSTISFEIFTSSTKKLRKPRKRRRKPIAFHVENIVQSSSKAETFDFQDHSEEGITSPSDLHEEYEAVKAAAILAAEVALAARARASAKAVTAVKAAAVAKAALEAAALAARGAEICRRSTSTEASCEASFVSRSDEIAVNSNRDIDFEKNSILSFQSNASFHDEELARLLHRAINSSPRISSSITPDRKKAREGAGSELTAETFTSSTQAASVPASGSCNPQAAIMSIATPLIENEQQPLSINTKVDNGHAAPDTKNSPLLPFILPVEDSLPQAIQSKVGNNSSSMLCVDYTCNLSNDNKEHCTLSAAQGKCFVGRLEWKAAAAIEPKVVSFDKEKTDNSNKINLKTSVDMSVTLSADCEIKEAITIQPVMPELPACENKCKHADTIPFPLKALRSANLVERKEIKRPKGYSFLGLNKNISLHSTSPNGITVHSNLPIEMASFHKANMVCPKIEAKNCSEDGKIMGSSPKKEDEHSFCNFAPHLKFEKATVNLDLSQQNSRLGLTEAVSKFGVSEVEPSKLQYGSFAKVKSHVRKTFSVPVPLDFVYTPAVSTMTSGHQR